MNNLSYNVVELDSFIFDNDLIDEVVGYHSIGSKCLIEGKSYSHFLDPNLNLDDYKKKISIAIEGISSCGFYTDIQDLISQEINNVKLSINCLTLKKDPAIGIAKLITRNEYILEFLLVLDDQVTFLGGSYKNFIGKRVKVPHGLNPTLKPFLELLSHGFEIINSEMTLQYTGKKEELYDLYDDLNLIYTKSSFEEFIGIFGDGTYYGPIVWLGSDGKSCANELLYFITKSYELGLINVKRDKNDKIRPNYNLIKKCFVKSDISEFNVNFKSIKQQLNNLAESKRLAIDNILSNYK